MRMSARPSPKCELRGVALTWLSFIVEQLLLPENSITCEHLHLSSPFKLPPPLPWRRPCGAVCRPSVRASQVSRPINLRLNSEVSKVLQWGHHGRRRTQSNVSGCWRPTREASASWDAGCKKLMTWLMETSLLSAVFVACSLRIAGYWSRDVPLLQSGDKRKWFGIVREEKERCCCGQGEVESQSRRREKRLEVNFMLCPTAEGGSVFQSTIPTIKHFMWWRSKKQIAPIKRELYGTKWFVPDINILHNAQRAERFLCLSKVHPFRLKGKSRKFPAGSESSFTELVLDRWRERLLIWMTEGQWRTLHGAKGLDASSGYHSAKCSAVRHTSSGYRDDWKYDVPSFDHMRIIKTNQSDFSWWFTYSVVVLLIIVSLVLDLFFFLSQADINIGDLEKLSIYWPIIWPNIVWHLCTAVSSSGTILI